MLFLCSAVFSDSLQHALDRGLGKSNAAVFITDIKTGTVIASIRPEVFSGEKKAMGSLIKVFTVLAFYRDHGKDFPVLNCPRTLATDPQGCWDRNGHGRVDVTRAIAHSCNVYFRQLSNDISATTFTDTLKRFGLADSKPPLGDAAIRKQMVGHGNEWKDYPALFVRAYAAIFNGGSLYSFDSAPASHVLIPVPAFHIIRNGMGLSSAEGTSMEARKMAGAPVFGKTGTSLQEDDTGTNWRKTQGWWIGMYPSPTPEIAIMAYVPEGRGATDAAPLGGKALHIYRSFKSGQ